MFNEVPAAAPIDPTPCLSRPDDFWSLPRCSVALLSSERGERLVVAGALEAASLPAFTAQVDQLMCTACRTVHLDLTVVSAMDETASRAVEGLRSYVNARGGEITITWPKDRTEVSEERCEEDRSDRAEPTPFRRRDVASVPA